MADPDEIEARRKAGELKSQEQSVRERVRTLRECCVAATKLSQNLAALMDPAVKTATSKDLWTGPFASQSTRQLFTAHKDLGRMAGDLQADRDRWSKEADRLESEADGLRKERGKYE